MDKSSFFSRLGDYLQANRQAFLIVALVLVAAGGYIWWQAGFSLDFMRFFAIEQCVIEGTCEPEQHLACSNMRCVLVNGAGADSCSADADCGPSCGGVGGTHCSGTSSCPAAHPVPIQRTSDCGMCCGDAATPQDVACSDGAATCKGGCSASEDPVGTCVTGGQQRTCCKTKPDTACADGAATCKTSCAAGENNVGSCRQGGVGKVCCKGTVPGPTTGGICDGASNRHTVFGGKYTLCHLRFDLEDPDLCTVNPSGTYKVVVGVENDSGSNVTGAVNMFSDPVAGCGATATQVFNDSGFYSVSGSVGAHSDGSITYTVNAGAFGPQCGRVQVDARLYGPDGRLDDVNVDGGGGKFNPVGKVLNYGSSCVAPTHLECVNNTCSSVSGAGANQCSPAGSACGTPTTHLECVNNTCASVSGAGVNQCSPAGSSCGTPVTHLECVSNTCTAVSGAGTDLCSPAGSSCGTVGSLICAPNSQTVDIGENADFSVSGGVAPYSWTAPNGSPTSGAGTTFSTSYAAAGNYQVGVFDSSSVPSAVCNVTVVATTPELSCASLDTEVAIGEAADFTAQGGTGTYTWYMPGGSPSTANGTPMAVVYAVPGFKTVTVVNGGNQASCTVTVTETVTEEHNVCQNNACVSVSGAGEDACSTDADCAEEESHMACNSQNACVSVAGPGTDECDSNSDCAEEERHLACSSQNACVSVAGAGEDECDSNADCTPDEEFTCEPDSQSVGRDEYATVRAIGATASLSWSSPSAERRSGTCGTSANCDVRYGSNGTYQVTVTNGTGSSAPSATCDVTVTGGGGGGGGSFRLDIDKLVKNITQSSAEQDSVNANPGNTIEFVLRVTSTGSSTVRNVTVRDSLPAGLAYVNGSTTVDGVAAADGIVYSGINIGDMPRNKVITIRFRTTVVASSFFNNGTTVLTNTGFARGTNAPEVSDTAFVTVVKSSGGGGTPDMSLTKMGRNITRGETAETSPVRSSPAQTVGFVLRVRNTSSRTLNNVMLRDVLPPEITLVKGSVRIGTASASDSLTAAGLSLGTMTAGQEVVVRFSGLVAAESKLPQGTTVVINTTTVTATGVPSLSAQLPVIISNGIVIPDADTGPGEATVLALIISAIITLLYVGYTSTETYRRHEAGSIAGEAKERSPDFKG